MSNIPRRDVNRPGFAARKSTTAADIMADIARRAALPKDHPEHAIDDDQFTGTMGIRDSKALRENATDLTRVKKRPKKK